jgi:isocitrate dehydrogenase
MNQKTPLARTPGVPGLEPKFVETDDDYALLDRRAESEVPIAVAPGDGVGPEITDAVLRVLNAAGAPLRYDKVEMGRSAYERGVTSGIPNDTWEKIRENGVLLKGPVTTPQGGGYKSLNVTLRKALNLYANVRPVRTYTPFVGSDHPDMDVVVVRENEEGLYAGIEHQQTREVSQILKLITRPGSERVIRHAFEYARTHNRDKVTCMTKDNIMKHTDGLFSKVFEEVSDEYPDVEAEHLIIDIGAARLATRPEEFDVVVSINLYGDILSDITAEIAGSVGLAGTANIGPEVSLFEAVHGSAPDIAGEGVANPSGMLKSAIEMLVHLGHVGVAREIENAWLRTLEDGLHTPDIYREGVSKREVGTAEFADAVIDRLGESPFRLSPARYGGGSQGKEAGVSVEPSPTPQGEKILRGIDVFVDWDEDGRNPDTIGDGLDKSASKVDWYLEMITNRGVKVYPDGHDETFWTDHWRCRFIPADDDVIDFDSVLDLLSALHDDGWEVIKTEQLYTFDGRRAYSLGQGQ